jgi:hypothetical protein
MQNLPCCHFFDGISGFQHRQRAIEAAGVKLNCGRFNEDDRHFLFLPLLEFREQGLAAPPTCNFSKSSSDKPFGLFYI